MQLQPMSLCTIQACIVSARMHLCNSHATICKPLRPDDLVYQVLMKFMDKNTDRTGSFDNRVQVCARTDA